MSVVITNLGPCMIDKKKEVYDHDLHEYAIKINELVVTHCTHRRSHGLSALLRAAAYAVDSHEDEEAERRRLLRYAAAR